MQTGSLDEKKFLSDISRIATALERLVEVAEAMEKHVYAKAEEARRPWTGGPR